MNDRIDCERAFVRLTEGLMHYRHAGHSNPSSDGTAAGRVAVPVLAMHASPASSRSLEPMTLALARLGGGKVIAPDTPGNGDSAALHSAQPELGDYADAMLRLLDALGIERANLYGFHTGAHIAIEMAIACPDRIGRVALDGLLWLDDSERREFLAEYAPPLQADIAGTQFFRAVQFIRDQAWFFPHFKRDAAHNLGGGAMPAELLHTLTVELLKAAPTYHLAYNAVFRHRLEERLPLLSAPALLLADDTDPTRPSVQRAAQFIPAATLATGGEGWSPAGLERKAKRLLDFFGG